MRLCVLVFGLVFTLLATAADNSKSRVDGILAKMTLEEKIDFLGGYKDFNIRPYLHLGIPEIRIADGPVGVRNFGESTAYPASINLAASFDKTLAFNTGRALGMDARQKGVHLLLGPGFNIYRLPITGRNFEYMGEDPVLAGILASQYIEGLQGMGVMANAKHYVANNQEFDRNNVSSDMEERTLHEIYLRPFEMTVKDANVATVMTGYNPVNGIQMSQHDYLNNDVLKERWGFEGFVVSDWASTYDGVAAANGGLDLEMPSGANLNREILMPAIKEGKVSIATIDDKIRRILNTYERFGFFDQADLAKDFTHDSEFVRKAALDAARGGQVLLKNHKQFLPLDPTKKQTIAIIGPNGNVAVTGGGGSSFTRPLHPMSLAEAVQIVTQGKANLIVEKGAFTGAPFPAGLFDDFPFYTYKDGKKIQGAKAEFFIGKELAGEPVLTQYVERVHHENEELWAPEEIPLTRFSVRFTSYFKPEVSGYYSLGGRGDDGYRILLDDVEVLNLWRNQGPTNGKEDIFMNAGQEYKVVTEFYQDGGGALIYQGIKKVELAVMPDAYQGNAIAAAKQADLVIMAVGFGPGTEGEAFDRTFEMPYHQNKLIQDVAAVNKNIVVVLNAGGNVDMTPWIDQVKAVLMAWYPGQEGALASAEILFGKTNPSGKLPASFEYQMEDNPTFNHYFDPDNDKRVFYGEGIFMGYRYWDQTPKSPRFPFGFGLSYTTFKYSNFRVARNEYREGEAITAEVIITNTGKVAGSEAVQLYVADKKSKLPRPVKELRAFDKVHLESGESKVVAFTLERDAFTYYDSKVHDWVLEPGEFELIIAASSEDIRGKLGIIIAGE